MKTPYFLISKTILDKNIEEIQTALERYWPNSILSYSVKTNSLPWLLEYIRNYNIKAEVVSDEEYELSKLCGFNDEDIVFNGPVKGEPALVSAIRNGAFVNLDSDNDLQLFTSHFREYQPNVGIRVNIDATNFSEKDVWYQEDGYRFGFSEETGDFEKALNILRFNDQTNKVGLHFHCSSATRSVAIYRRIAEHASYLIEKYEIEPSYIDIGGGFFGGVEGKPSAPDYIKAVYDELKKIIDPEKIKLIIEPGSAIIGSAVSFHTSVLDVKDTQRSTIVTTDGSRINIDPLWSKSNYAYKIEKTERIHADTRKKQIVCGYTCIEHDRIMILLNKERLLPGDKLIYEKIGAYSVTFGGPFIKYFPDVYVESPDRIKLVRSMINVLDYFAMHSCL